MAIILVAMITVTLSPILFVRLMPTSSEQPAPDHRGRRS